MKFHLTLHKLTYDLYTHKANPKLLQYTFEQISEVIDEDDTYWEPVDSINELYKQFSSKKYREIAPHKE